MDSPVPLVSVIIPVYNDGDGLERCLGCLSSQTELPSRFEVIVVDNGSDMPIEPQTALSNLKVVREYRRGSYAARNRGLELARGRVVAFTDADCLPRQDWISCGIAALANFNGHAVLGGRINTIPECADRPRAVELYELALAMVQSDFVSDEGFAATANMWTTRKTFDAVGAFDPARLSGGDVEWSMRARKAGVPVAYSDDVIIDHPARRTWAELYRKLRRVRSGRLLQTTATSAALAWRRRSVREKLERFSRRTRGWRFHHRAAALMVAIVRELATPIADLELRWRKYDRL